MSNHPTLKVPQERIAQLKQMAANMGATNMSEVVAKLIEFAQNEGLISHKIPGVDINVLSDGMAIRFDEGKTVGFSFAEARLLVSEIRHFLNGDRSASQPNGKFMLKGKGQGISVAIPVDSPSPKVFDRGLADEFARLLEKASQDTDADAKSFRMKQPDAATLGRSDKPVK